MDEALSDEEYALCQDQKAWVETEKLFEKNKFYFAKAVLLRCRVFTVTAVDGTQKVYGTRAGEEVLVTELHPSGKVGIRGRDLDSDRFGYDALVDRSELKDVRRALRR